MKKVCIIVPVFKREKMTEKFIDSIISQNKSFSITFIIVDDDEEQYGNYKLIGKHPNVICLKTKGNLWWCGSVREGINYFNSNFSWNDDDIVVIANNDVTIPTGQLDKILLSVSSNEICHPKTVNNNNVEISSGAKVISWFPYLTRHPKKESENSGKVEIDLCTARFMCMNVSTLKLVGNISINLLQYQGDYDFSLRAKKMGVSVNLINNVYCNVFDDDTGMKSNNILSIKGFFKSLFEIRSANNIKYRWFFLRNHFNMIFSFFIMSSMFFNMVARYILQRFK